jgi:hypothetical protein|tara:strand:- start:614 stop:808 length:195 start_codon:yes stop_codon:yes gene_type:complete
MNKGQIVIITIQTISVIMMFFFGWLGTKMELPDGITNFWFWLNIICLLIYYIAGRLGHKVKIDK